MTAVIPDVALSPYAVSLLRVLTVPGAAEDDPIAREPVDTFRLSDREFGVLLPVAFRLSAQHPAHRVVGAIVTAGRLRQPAFTPESCAAMLSVAVEKLERGGYGGYSVLAVNALARCEGPLPEEAARSAGKLVTLLGDRYRLDHPYALMALAGLGGGLTARIASKLFAWSLHSIARDEAAVVSALGPTAQALLAEASGESSYHSPQPLPDLWQRLADMPKYASFAHRALEAAHRRVADIQSGRIA